MHIRRFFIISALLFLTIPTFSQSYLHVFNKSISDPNGSAIILKGIGLGGWLVPEGYMLQTDGFANSPTEIRNKIESLIGTDETNKFFDKYRANFVTRKDIEMIASLGFNSVRLPMHYNLLSPKDSPYVYTESGFVLIDSLLQQCEDNHIYLILDLHCAFGGQNSANISDYDSNYPSLWQDTSNQNRTVELWKKLAQRYSTRKWIGGYDLLNETVWNLPNNTALRSLYIKITNAIRSVDPNHIIYIEGNQWANDFTGLTPAWDNNMVYSFHKYWNDNTIGSIQGYIDIRNSTNRPLWLGESGENNNQWCTEAVALVEQNNISWSWWTLKKIESVSGFFLIKKPAEYDAVLNYWKGTGSKPSSATCIDAFTKLADNLLLQNCVFNQNVIDALIRQPGTYVTIPFKPNAIPGIVYASDYDLGRSGFAYQDLDVNNSGGAYRNDNVDIEPCSDLVTNGYNVGWINGSEFLKYTIDVKQSGIYSITFRAAANSAGGTLQYKLDDLSFSSVISIPSTGGWQKWGNSTVSGLHLIKGSHTFQINFIAGGYNLNYMKFDLTSPDSVDPISLNSYELLQNYPNPFNPSTNIDFTIKDPGSVKFKIYNALGDMVNSFAIQYGESGKHSVKFTADNLPSGVYFYKIEAGAFVQVKKMVLIR